MECNRVSEDIDIKKAVVYLHNAISRIEQKSSTNDEVTSNQEEEKYLSTILRRSSKVTNDEEEGGNMDDTVGQLRLNDLLKEIYLRLVYVHCCIGNWHEVLDVASFIDDREFKLSSIDR